MAFVLTNESLRRIAPLGAIGDYTSNAGGSFSYLYGYKTADLSTAVETAGYFDLAYQWLNVGDVILAINNAGGTPVLKYYVVLTNAVATGGHITIGLQTTTAG